MSLSFWALAGDKNTLKSSILRALTGVERSGSYQVELVSGAVITAHIETCTPQERKRHILPHAYAVQLAAEARYGRATHIIVPLLYRPNSGNTNSAQNYLDHFVSRGWKCLGVASTHTALPLPCATCTPGALGVAIPFATHGALQPVNALAEYLRMQWGIR